ncbi:MAG: tetratricopeptide repeat protein [Anaerolineales bacterium]|jgi:soluble lytic murein transglycosylase|nr:tetratricopeptide repeat protein [Anaerolineales bacterium]
MKIKIALLLGLILGLAACSMPVANTAKQAASPGPLQTATSSPIPLPTATPAPTATPFPAARISSGEKAIFLGNYSGAREEFRLSLAGSDDPAVRASALWGLGKTEFLDGNFAAALEQLRVLTQNYPESETAAQAWFLLAETYFDLGRYQESADTFAVYLQMRPGLLDRFVQTRRGDGLRAAGRPLEAISAYQAALETGVSDPIPLKLEIAQAYSAAGDPQSALILADEIEAATRNDYVKAQLYLLAGQAYLQMGDPSAAYEKWQFTVNNYPLAYDSYSALVGLVEAGQPVDEFSRGLVDYFARQYDVALAAFDRYIAINPAHDGSVLHYKALTLRELGSPSQAVAIWDELIQKYPASRFWAAAWEEKGFTQWAYLNDYKAGAETFEQFVNAVPGSPFVVSYTLSAARIHERGGNLERAAELWEMVALQYPNEIETSDALFQAAIAHYRRGDYERARDNFQRTLVLAQEPVERARAQLWVGKSLMALNDKQGAYVAWQAAQAIMPNGYYSLRARDLLLGRQPFEAPPVYNFDYSLDSERSEAISWMRVRFNLGPEVDLSNPRELASDPRFQRGLEFWQIGLYDQARLEFEELRLAIEQDPLNTFRLGNYLLDLGLYRPAITALRQVLTLAGLNDQSASLTAPVYFSHARYGLYYPEIIFPAAQEYNFDPILITSLIRQESLFEGFVRSSAGAHGLMQIMPVTGASIAEQMGWPPNYNSEMLYSPQVSVRMGTFYLNSNRRYLEGNLYASLAGYNAGPGNAAIWKSLAPDDPDLQLEVIRYQETRDYLRGIYEIYNVYRNLYSPVQQ